MKARGPKIHRSEGRGTCPFCRTRVKIISGLLAPHPIPGNARGASRCAGMKPKVQGPKSSPITADLARRAEIFAPGKHHPCYDGQWTVHGPHSYEVRVQYWLGGGTETVTCHGVKPGETLPERHAR